MAKTVLYIATSLDGYIARPDGSLDWLTSIPNPEQKDYGYANLLESIETIIMGRKTYQEIIGFGIDWPYSDYQTFIVTSDHQLEVQTPNTHLLTKNISETIPELKNNSSKDIWLVGGGQLIQTFLNEGLLDKMILSVIPKIIGAGIPLFSSPIKESCWHLIETKSFTSGVVNLTYIFESNAT